MKCDNDGSKTLNAVSACVLMGTKYPKYNYIHA